MSADFDVKSDWIRRVLGFELPRESAAALSTDEPEKADESTAPLSGTLPVHQTARMVWSDASDTVESQLAPLYDRLRLIGPKVLAQIADDLASAVANIRAGLETVLVNHDKAPPSEKPAARAAALKVLDDYKQRIPAEKLLRAAETNPFKLPVTIQATLGAALNKVGTQLGAK